MQFVNLSPTIYSNANTNRLLSISGYNSVHPWQLMFPCLTSHICGAIARSHWQWFITVWYHLSFSDGWWYTWLHPGAHLFLKKQRSWHKLLSAVTAILTWTILRIIVIYCILSFHFMWNTWDISASYMVSLKDDFEEFRSKHWLYTDAFADISNEIPVIPKLYPQLQFYMSKMLVRVRWILRESKTPYTAFPLTKSIVKDLITSKDSCLYLDSMYYNNTLNIHDCVKTFKHHLQNDTWSYYT